MAKMYVWLNIQTGEFSNSWTEEEHKRYFSDENIAEHTKERPLWKLIVYECLNDKEFIFNRHMVIK